MSSSNAEYAELINPFTRELHFCYFYDKFKSVFYKYFVNYLKMVIN